MKFYHVIVEIISIREILWENLRCDSVINHLLLYWYLKNDFNKKDFGNLNDHLLRNKIPMMYIGQGYGSLEFADKNNKIILMTYHSSKGLDFDHVFLPMLGENIYLPIEKAETLLFVALSRSKSNLLISYSGNLFIGWYEPTGKENAWC